MSTLNLPVQSYEHRSRHASAARLLNCYPELMPPGGRSPVLLARAPGIRPWIRVGAGPIHAMYTAYVELSGGAQTYLYVVSGTELYYVKADGEPTLIGDIGPVNSIDIDSNVGNVVVVNTPDAYYWDGSTFGQITDADFVDRGAGDVEFLDNFMLFREPDSGRFFGADLGSVTDFNALRFATAETSPDNLVGMKALHRILYNFGATSLELWQNTGASGFPFERIVNGTIEMGCLNARTVAETNNVIMWVADDYTVRQLQGTSPVRISTHAIEQKISKATHASASAFTYEQEGHFFYALSFDEGTYIYDLTTGEWADRGSYNEARWLASSHAQFNGLELVGNRDSNEIGILDPEYYWDWGEDAENIVNSSGDLSTANWTESANCNRTGSYAKALDGRTTATQIIDNGATGTGVVFIDAGNLTFKAATDYVYSVVAKPDDLNWMYLWASGFTDVTTATGYFDLQNGVLGTFGADIKDKGIEALNNGYYLCWMRFTTETDTTGIPRIYVADADGDTTVDLDNSSSITVDRVQIAEGTKPKAYIETGAAAVSRIGVQRMEWTYQTVYAEGQRAFHDRFEVVLETGTGATTGQGNDPQIILEYADDGAETWRAMPARSIGALGKRESRVVWHNLGSARQRTYRVAISDPVAVTVTDTLLHVRGGRL